jgi:membrane protease YdiL (CAAX protease family)
MNRNAVPRPWVIFLAIFVLTVPFIVLGLSSSARVLPGIPLSGFAFLCIAAVAFWAAWRTGGLAGMRALLGRVFDARRAKPWTWHLVAVLVFPALLLLEYAIMRVTQMPLPAPRVMWLQSPLLFVAFFVGAACEEVAWSATLLEPLQARYGALVAALLIGVFGVVLHVVPFVQANSSVSWVVGQCLFIVAFRVVVAWIYNVSGHSLFSAVLCHAAYNTAWQLFPNQGSGYNPWITAGLTFVVVVVVVAVFGARTLAGRHPSSAPI